MIAVRAAALTIVVFCGFMLPAVARAASAGDSGHDRRYTALIQDQSIQDALEAVGLLAGRQIVVMGLIEDRKVSVTLNNATLAKSIEKVLSPSNYVIVWSDEESLVVLMLDGNGEPALAGSGSRENADHGLVSLFPDSPAVLPPSHPGGEGLTLADIEYYRSFAPDPDPSEAPVFPLSSPDEEIFTEQDLADFLANREPEPLDSDLVPRDSAGHSVITLRHVENMRRAAMLEPQPSQVVLWPVDDSGLSFTVPRELLIPNGRAEFDPNSLADLFPPD